MEILFLPLSFHRRTRPLAWSAVLSMHLGILLMVDFTDLSFGMVYDWIGRNRYQWFGKLAEWRIPSAEMRARFLP